MDRPNRGCNSEPGYSYLACLQSAVSDSSGCRLPWDVTTSPSLPLCVDQHKLKQVETAYFRLASGQRQDVEAETGCLHPCVYTEYKIVGDAEYPQSYSGVGFSFANTEIIHKKEVLSYPFYSFVAEVGGSLGLFLGFSFIMLWDVFHMSWTFIHKLTKTLK